MTTLENRPNTAQRTHERDVESVLSGLTHHRAPGRRAGTVETRNVDFGGGVVTT
jgi:hypothetical protein